MAKRKRKQLNSAGKTAERRNRAAPREVIPLPDMQALEAAFCEAELIGSDLGRDGVFCQGDSPLTRAQEIIFAAFETDDRRKVELAQQALAICPDCADAHVILAEHAADLGEATELFKQGVAAAERALGKETFRRYEGEFWGVVETRPYMRARMGLAQCLLSSGLREEAADHLQDMLRLNPMDNQGVRWVLARCLLELGRDDDLGYLLAEYPEDCTANWVYTGALLAFRRHGDCEEARLPLAEATECNRHVPAYLLGDTPLPSRMPEYFSLGEDDEAVLYAAEFLPGWKATPGAIAWLRRLSCGLSSVSFDLI